MSDNAIALREREEAGPAGQEALGEVVSQEVVIAIDCGIAICETVNNGLTIMTRTPGRLSLIIEVTGPAAALCSVLKVTSDENLFAPLRLPVTRTLRVHRFQPPTPVGHDEIQIHVAESTLVYRFKTFNQAGAAELCSAVEETIDMLSG